MSSLEPKTEKDLIAVKAGINVNYPGIILALFLCLFEIVFS